MLYFSPVLSVNKSLSCASCHDPKNAFADGKRVSTGVHGKTGTRNAPTVLNAAYYKRQFWDGRAASLEEQASGPMMNPVEMGHSLEALLLACDEDGELRRAMTNVYGEGPITIKSVTKAIAAFERTLLSGNSPFDRYRYGGGASALSEPAKRGLEVFLAPGKGHCNVCHVIGPKFATFTDDSFHNIGVGLDPQGEIVDEGRFKVTKREADRGVFRTPSLRNVALTAPYMHDGSLKTLKDVVDFYVGGGSSNPNLDKQIHPLNLTRQEREDLVAFLESLTGEMPK